ncbi:thiolase family protein [Bradyrhizobium sp. INPA01-394B]|uniref:Thiolase family protein n=1 Tax=Bradyrhizobium campsiandrae TaxID=1729892 RepID=A0ABR7U3H2_9BRAD|nr:thiolase family protein [Bradyrhizobium campsiandrae]MBC9879850.1 thiolase family protein [Bradyrhizobium campsiandrae]MBC9978535.1 thiolase family protein [Bradyrhizobium campsiandrae]
MSGGVVISWDGAYLVDGVRTPFVDYNGALASVSPIDLGIKVGREAVKKSGIDANEIGTVICGSVAQTSFDAYMLPRHIGLYSGAPIAAPAHLVQRVCGTGIEILSQAADAVSFGRAEVALCVGTESMSRNPVAAYTHRSGFRMGQIEFKDFLWESLLDTAAGSTMGQTAEKLAIQYQLTREEVDAFASRSFDRAITANERGFFSAEIVPVKTETFERDGFAPRGIKLAKGMTAEADTHVKPSPVETLAKIPPAFDGVQTGGNSSAIVDGAAAGIVASGEYVKRHNLKPMARIAACASFGVQPEVMGIGPVPAIRLVLERAGLKLSEVDRIEINEAFAAQTMACARELGLDEEKLNVNGGAIAMYAYDEDRLIDGCARARRGL